MKVFAAMAVELENLGCDSICIKDMAGLISPRGRQRPGQAHQKRVHIPSTCIPIAPAAWRLMSYYAAALAGVDILDTAFSAFAWGTSQPPTESMVAALKDTPFRPASTWSFSTRSESILPLSAKNTGRF